MSRFPLTLLEQYFLAEDKPAYPSWVFLRFRLRGTIQREILHAAWREVVRRHPTLHAQVLRRSDSSPPAWEPASDDHEPAFVWKHGRDVAAVQPWTAVDLGHAPGVRLVVAETDGQCEISLEGHHALYDGLGAFAVAHDLFLSYARRLGAPVEVPECRPERFAQRNHFGLGWWERLKLTPVQLLGLWFAWQMQRRPVAQLAPHAVADFSTVPPEGFPHVLHQNLAGSDFARLRAVAKQNQATLNDLLIRDLQAAIGVWRVRESIGAADDWVVVGVPVNLRQPADRSLPAANVISIVAIDRRARSLADRPRLLRRAREDMGLVKRHKLGYTFLVLLGWWRHRRGGIARYSNTPGCRATVVLTNLGQPFSDSPLCDASQRLALPGAMLEEFSTIAPYRPGTAASIAVATYAGHLQVDLHYDPRALNERRAEAFLAAFFEQLHTSIGETVTPGQVRSSDRP